MSGEDDPAGVSGRRALIEVLEVRRRARIGFVVGTVLAVGLFVLFVVLPEAEGSAALYLALGVVLAVSLGLLVTGILVGAAVIRLLRHPETIPDLIEDDED